MEDMEKEVNIGEVVWRLLCGWKVILSAVLLGGVLGVGVVWFFPSRYEAKVLLSVGPGEAMSPVASAMLGGAKPKPELLQEYAAQISSPAVLEKTIQELSQELPGGELVSTEKLRSVLAVSPLKEEARLAVSAVMSDPEFAKTVVGKIVENGIQQIEQFRASQQEAVRKYWASRVASAQRAYEEAQAELNRLKEDQKYTEKTVRVLELNRRVELLRQISVSAEAELAKLETRLRTWETLLPTLPSTISQSVQVEPGNLFWRTFADKWGISEKQLDEMKFIWTQLSPIHGNVTQNLLQDRVALETLQGAQQLAQKMLPQYQAELNQAQAELDALNASLAIAQGKVGSALNGYKTAQEALAKWESDFLQTFPVVQAPSAFPIQVQRKGLSPLYRWIGIEMLAFCIGIVGVFLVDEIRRQRDSFSTYSSRLPLPSEKQEPLLSRKISA